MKTRKRKIQMAERKNRRAYVHFPSFVLSGQWLKKAGFNIGDIVNIDVTDNKLIITKQLNN